MSETETELAVQAIVCIRLDTEAHYFKIVVRKGDDKRDIERMLEALFKRSIPKLEELAKRL